MTQASGLFHRLFAHPRGGALAVLVAGAIAPLALAPFNFWPLFPLSLALLLLSLQQQNPRQALWRGWLYGLGLFGIGASWIYVSIHEYGYASVPLAAFLTLLFVCGLALLFCASFGWTYARLFGGKNQANAGVALLGFPALWVLFEWLRAWVLTGFPWLLAGYSQTDTVLLSFAPVLGIYSLSFLVAFSAGVLVLTLNRTLASDWRRLLPPLSLLALPWLAAAGLALLQWTEPLPEPLTATLLQPNVTQDKKWLPEQRPKTLAFLRSQTLAQLDADLVLWPENAVPAFYFQAQDYLDKLSELAQAQGLSIVTGIPHYELDANQQPAYHNSIMALGAGTGIYHKQKLVPFGEYVPFQDLLRGLIAFFDLPMSNFRRGPANQQPLLLARNGAPLRLAPFICYEIVYPDFVRAAAAASDLLITISDDSWFGRSIGPHQHLQMARMRAVENGRSLLRATNTGISAAIDADGAILALAPQFVATNLRTTLPLYRGMTPFGRFGSWPILGLCGVIVLTLAAAGRFRRDP